MTYNCDKQLWLLSPDGESGYGGHQEWYPQSWQRKAGCGPTVGANIIWYLARTRPELLPLWPHSGSHKAHMLRLMEETWPYITPTAMGVNKTSILRDGIRKFAGDKGIDFATGTLEIPPLPMPRPKYPQVRQFIAEAMSKDRPIAFLNLSNGALTALDSWHWVTLIAIDPLGTTATMMDQGKITDIDLEEWLCTSNLGGGFVWADKIDLSPKSAYGALEGHGFA